MGRLTRRARRVLLLMAADLPRRVRQRGRSALLRAGRMTGATVAAFLVAELRRAADAAPAHRRSHRAARRADDVGRHAGVRDRSACSAWLPASRSPCCSCRVVGLTWWSLGALVAASIIVGQVLRLGPNLVEVPISAMLVLGVGYSAGARVRGRRPRSSRPSSARPWVCWSTSCSRPPCRPGTPDRRSRGSPKRSPGSSTPQRPALSAGAVTEEQTTQWLEDARRLNRHAPRVDRALAHAEESRRLNLRALGTPAVGPGLREGVDALEHSSVSMRTLFRAIDDATRQQTGVRESPDYVDAVRASSAFLMRQMGNAIRAFGRLLRRELEMSGEPERSGEKEQEQLAGALEELDGARREVHELLLADPRSQHGPLGAQLGAAHDRRPHADRARRRRPHPATAPARPVDRTPPGDAGGGATARHHPSPCPPHRNRSLHRGPGPMNRIGADRPVLPVEP